MSLSVFFCKDIKHVLLGLVISTIQQGAGNFEFVRGKLSAIQSAAASFGIDWPELVKEAKSSLAAGETLLESSNYMKGITE